MKKLIIPITILLLSSCYTAKKAEHQVDKAMGKYPEQSVTQLRTRFPCIVTEKETDIKIDTVTELVEVICDTTYLFNTDTIISSKPVYVVRPGKTIKVPCQSYNTLTTVTIRIKDSGEVFVLTRQVAAKDARIKQLEGKVDGKQTWIWWLIVLCAILAILNVIQFKRG